MSAQAAESMDGLMIASSVPENFSREVLVPAQCRELSPDSHGDVLLYRYHHNQNPWTLCIATRGEQGSGKLSLGGFRIVPESRTAVPGFSPEREAIGLACGMEEKVFWSRLLQIAGPLGLRNLNRIVGGKCVLLPTQGSRVGEPADIPMLAFAIAALLDFESHAKISITTGQDLGHGVLSDGKTSSLQFLSAGFHGSIMSDTSEPTAEGNLFTLLGMLRGVGIDPIVARVGLIGYGNIGHHLVRRLEELFGPSVYARLSILEPVEAKRRDLAAKGARVFGVDERKKFLAEPISALVLNANGGSLDSDSVSQILQNPNLQVICGCENLVMPNQDDASRLQLAGKIYCPTELCGMMGYLTAVEEYLSTQAGGSFQMKSILSAATKLEVASLRACKRAQADNCSFEDAMRREYA